MKYDYVSSSSVFYSVLPIEFHFLMAGLFQLLLFSFLWLDESSKG